MNLKEISIKEGVSADAIKKRIKRTLKANPELYRILDLKQDFSPGVNDIIPDGLIGRIVKNFNLNQSTPEAEKTPRIAPTPIEIGNKDLVDFMSSDWIVGIVLIFLMLADSMSFYIVAKKTLSHWNEYIPLVFSAVGFFTTMAMVTTYTRTENKQVREAYKWAFAACQVVLFGSILFEQWIIGKAVMTIMTPVTFAGFVSSIKK